MEKDFIKNNEAKAIIIGEIDGSMVPLVSKAVQHQYLQG